jgi:hypothetical protein
MNTILTEPQPSGNGTESNIPPNPVEQFLRSERMPHIW